LPKFKVNLGDRETEVEVTRREGRVRVTIAGKTTELTLIHKDGPAFTFEYEDAAGIRRRVRAAGVTDSDQRQLWVNGRILRYERIRERHSAGTEPGSNSLSASIPAVVSELLVNVGDAVAEGEKLLLLESMKMVIPIQSPCKGTVTAINCAAGDAVQPGIPLIEIEET